MIETEEQIGGQRLEPGEKFCFSCHSGLECFNTCCRDKRLPLWPYDMLRLVKGLGISSSQVLEKYVELELDPRSGWPALRIKLDSDGRCTLLSPQGCSVYAHRPSACRIYPLAWALAPGPDGGPGEEVFMRQETPGCLGWGEPAEHTTDSWAADQGLAEYLQANSSLLGLWFHPSRRGRMELEPAQVHAVIAALYNPDVFLQMVLDPKKRKTMGISPARAVRAKRDDLELLKLGRDWLIKKLL